MTRGLCGETNDSEDVSKAVYVGMILCYFQ